ncbi:MAG: MBOAT family protein [Chitinophagaceae bacterium]|nr:MBOAT family protein [Chitinophagaceae bacterium]
MLFNSVEFLVFLPIVFLLYWGLLAKRLQWQNGLILLASYTFYGFWSWRFMALLMLSTLIDYGFAFGVAASNKARARFFLWMSIICNLGILAVFKYHDFFVLEMQQLLALVGIGYSPQLLQWVLPIGISFYTFHGMSYVIDIYRGSQKPVRHFVDYAVFVSFVPLLVAGPIERAHHLLPQVQRPRKLHVPQLQAGLRLMLWGMFKKVVIADSLALTVNEIFERYPEHNGFALLLGMLAFSFQIYADFSGYTDIAIGTAKLFGFELLSNFRFPYFSRNLAEFWHRWHISLSSWFRDYLYIPLGGSRRGLAITIRNTVIIFLVSGFWHGANTTFIVWGFIHACGFLPLLLLGSPKSFAHTVVAQDRLWPTIKELLQMTATFLFVSLAWVFFRAADIGTALKYLCHMATSFWAQPSQLLQIPYGASAMLYILPLVLIDWWLRRDERELRTINNKAIRYAVYFALAMITLTYLQLFTSKEAIDFIYFQF